MQKILVVDDAPKYLQQLAANLHAAGYNVAAASTPAQALQKARQIPFDLYVLDAVMPQMDGFELWHNLHALHPEHHVPTLFLINRTNDQQLGKVFELPQSDYLSRPIHPAELRYRVQQQLHLPQAASPPAKHTGGQQEQLDDLRECLQSTRSALHLVEHSLSTGNNESLRQAQQLMRKLYHMLHFLTEMPGQ